MNNTCVPTESFLVQTVFCIGIFAFLHGVVPLVKKLWRLKYPIKVETLSISEVIERLKTLHANNPNLTYTVTDKK